MLSECGQTPSPPVSEQNHPTTTLNECSWWWFLPFPPSNWPTFAPIHLQPLPSEHFLSVNGFSRAFTIPFLIIIHHFPPDERQQPRWTCVGDVSIGQMGSFVTGPDDSLPHTRHLPAVTAHIILLFSFITLTPFSENIVLLGFETPEKETRSFTTGPSKQKATVVFHRQADAFLSIARVCPTWSIVDQLDART